MKLPHYTDTSDMARWILERVMELSRGFITGFSDHNSPERNGGGTLVSTFVNAPLPSNSGCLGDLDSRDFLRLLEWCCNKRKGWMYLITQKTIQKMRMSRRRPMMIKSPTLEVVTSASSFSSGSLARSSWGKLSNTVAKDDQKLYVRKYLAPHTNCRKFEPYIPTLKSI